MPKKRRRKKKTEKKREKKKRKQERKQNKTRKTKERRLGSKFIYQIYRGRREYQIKQMNYRATKKKIK